MSQWIKGVVHDNRQWTERLFSLQVKAELAPFTAGQFTRLSLIIDGEREARPYSFVNAPHESIAEFYFNTVPGGPLSNQLATLEAGDEIEISQPAAGFFTLSEVPQGRHLWMLATGTALGPFLSFLKTDEPWQRFEKLILVHAVRHAEDLNYAEIIAGFQAGHPEQFSFIPFVSREKHETALDGRIPEAIENGRLEGRAGVAIDPADSQFMLCGNLGMIQDTTAALQKRGLEKNRRQKPGQITTEKYW